ncbi:MAG: amidohydrolase family protein [Alphaproteobacteria bacterium]
MNDLLLTNARIIDGSGGAPFDGDILVEDGTIAQVRPANVAAIGGDRLARVDCGGRTVMPGMVEAHCHISFDNITSFEGTIMTPVEDQALVSLKNAQLLLQRGFTSLFSAAAAKPRLDVAVRDAIEAGHFVGPRIRACSQEITPSGNLGDANTNYLTLPRAIAFTVIADGADAFTEAGRLAARDGVDTLKVNVSGDRDYGRMHAYSTVTVITDAELAALVAVAKPRNMMVAAHCTSSDGVKMCIRHGVDVIYHAVFADAEARDMLEAAKDRVFVAPTIGFPWSQINRHREFGLPMPPRKLALLQEELATLIDCMSDLRKRGVRILPGGDYGAGITNPIGTNARDLEHFVGLLGFTPMEALVAATRLGGELMGEPERIGRLAPGAHADLLVVDGDPLDDIRILQDPDRLSAVMIGGRFARYEMPQAPQGLRVSA